MTLRALSALTALLFAVSVGADEYPSVSENVERPLAAPITWRIVESDSLDFQVLLPPGVERVESVRTTWVGKIEELSLEAVVEGGKFFVQVRQLPRAAQWLVTRNYIFGEVKDALLHDGERKELGDEELEHDGYPARLIRYEDSEREGWVEDALVLIGKNRIYLLVASRTRAASPSLPIEAFFESFQIH